MSATSSASSQPTYLRRLMVDTVSEMPTASIASGTGSDAETASKVLAKNGGAAATKKSGGDDDDDDDDDDSSSSTSSSTSTSGPSHGTDNDVGDDADGDDDPPSSTKTSNNASTDSDKKKATRDPAPTTNATKSNENAMDWYDDDATADGQSYVPAAPGTSPNPRSNETSVNATAILPNGRKHRDENNPHADKKGGDHTSTNDDDDAGYIFHNSTSNEDFVLDDTEPKTAIETFLSNVTKKSHKMSMAEKEGLVAAFILVAVAIGYGIYKIAKYFERLTKQRQRAGYQQIQ